MIIKKIKTLVCLLLVMTIVYNISSYATEDDSSEAIKYINDIREKMEIRLIENSKELEQSAASHSKYMSINDSFSTIEESGNKYYRGRYSWDRASYYYYFNPYVTEFIDNNIKSTKTGIVNFINNPYSRIVLLDPLYQHIGMGNNEDMYTFDLGGKSRELTVINRKIAIYPYNNMENVPVLWENNYKIDPYRDLEKEYKNVGLPITLSYYSDKLKIRKITRNEIILKNLDKDTEIKTETILPQDDKYIDKSLIILPLEALEYNTTYEIIINVDFIFEDKSEETDAEYTINFTTEKKDIPLNRGKFTEYLVKTLDLELLEPEEVFEDIDVQSSRAKYIYTAYKYNLVSGYGDNTFRPETNITKEQAYTLLIRAYEKEHGEVEIKDYPLKYSNYYGASSWAIQYIQKAEEIGLITTQAEQNYKKEITEFEYYKIIELYNSLYNNNNEDVN